jgi:hypothetical protein
VEVVLSSTAFDPGTLRSCHPFFNAGSLTFVTPMVGAPNRSRSAILVTSTVAAYLAACGTGQDGVVFHDDAVGVA